MSSAGRQILLTLLSVLTLVLFFSIPFYQDWFTIRVKVPLEDITEHLDYMEPEERKAIRFGSTYVLSKNISEYISMNKIDQDTVTVLLPPAKYIKDLGCDFSVPEPIVFYYYSGLRSKWHSSPGAELSNFGIVCENKELHLISLDREKSQAAVQYYSQYK